MSNRINLSFKLFLPLLSIASYIYSDSFDFNTYNNHGIIGLINTPTARFYEEGSHGITYFDGDPDQKITLSSNPYDWFEASFFYMNIEDITQCRSNNEGKTYCQGYKDKGFNVKIKLKDQGVLPALAVGLNDFAGTSLYSSEYLVSSYGINNLDMHLGVGWGRLSNKDDGFKNPFTYIHDSFNNRPLGYDGLGGELDPSKYFSGETSSFFYGISYRLNNKLLFKLEKDPTRIDGPVLEYLERESDFSYGFDYLINENFTIGTAYERGGFFSLRFVYKNNPKRSLEKYTFKKANTNEDDDKYLKLVKNLEENGIGVNKISETSRSIGIELTQFIHPDIRVVEQIIAESSREAGIEKNIKKNIKIADLDAVTEIDEVFERNAKTIYERNSSRFINTDTGLTFRPFIASREEFFKGALLVENNTEFILRDNLFFNTNLKYSLANNFDDLSLPPVDTFPAQVRSDVKQYLKNMDEGLLIGRAQLDYHITPRENHHIMITGGILEDMFSGYGAEYLYFKPNNNYSFGFEIFNVRKRDYEWRFGYLDYENTTFTANLFIRNFGSIPFDFKLSAGEYLAGDIGSTVEFSRSLSNGVRFGAFATFTDVSFEQFGEGSFDKGIFFDIPIYGNFINYTWRPLTKDPGARLNRRNSLHDLLVRFRPIN